MRTIIALAIALGLCGGTAFAQAPVPATQSQAMPTCASGDPVVWVNTSSNVYHMKGSKYFGKTKHGKYECKSAADASGARHAENEGGKKPAGTASPAPHAKPKHGMGTPMPATPSPESP